MRRRTRVALTLRVIFVIGIPAAYYLIGIFTGSSSTQEVKSNEIYGRKLLQLEPTLETITNVTEAPTLEELAGRNCTPAAILDFPSDGFTREQRQHGYVVIHVLVSCYSFILLAIVCDDYFVPAIALMCKKLKMKEDVAGATFMAAATSSPELFINCVGTFITEGDLGVGTIVGSAVFNILAVPACCGLFAGQVVYLDWWPVTRDSVMYGIAVLALIGTLADGKVMWYEALGLVSAYILYIIAMYFNDGMSNLARRAVSACCGRTRRKSGLYRDLSETEVSPLLRKDSKSFIDESTIALEQETHLENGLAMSHHEENEEETEYAASPWSRTPGDGASWWWVVRWPISFVLWITIPDCRRRPRLFPLTFGICIIWIGCTSYFVAYLITVVGDTINIPDSVMGLTFLAAGTSVPEAVSSVIVTNQGHGAMGISNSIGSNTFDVLLCLGLPWLIKSTLWPKVPGDYWVPMNSTGLPYSAVSLLSTLFGLYASFAINKFRLDWRIGVTCTLMYAAFMTFASLIETNFFFPVNLPTCGH